MCFLVREPDAGKPPVRFDERGVKTENGEASEAPATERAGNRYAEPKPPRHSSTLLILSGSENSVSVCAVIRHRFPVGASPTRPSLIAPAGSYRSGGGGNEAVGAFEKHAPFSGAASRQAVTRSEHRAGLETFVVGADPALTRGRPPSLVNAEGLRAPHSERSDPAVPPG